MSSVPSSSTLDYRFQELLDQQLREQERSDADFNAQMKENAERTSFLTAGIIEKATNRSNAQAMSPQVAAIVHILNKNPLIVPSVQAYMLNLMKKVSEAVGTALAENTPERPVTGNSTEAAQSETS